MTAIIGPDGHKTDIELYTSGGRDGYLKSVEAPDGSTYSLDYWDPSGDPKCKSDGSNCEGLLKHLTGPRGYSLPKAKRKKYRHTYRYDSLGRLKEDTGPGGFKKTLSRSPIFGKDGTRSGYKVDLDSHVGQSTLTTSYRVESKANASIKHHVKVLPGGQRLVRKHQRDGSVKIIAPNGTIATLERDPDPQFGSMVPTTGTISVRTPSGLKRKTSVDRTIKRTSKSNRLDVAVRNTSWTTNGQTVTQQFKRGSNAGSAGTITQTSPEGRKGKLILDAKGRPKRHEVPGLHPVRYRYRPSDGRLKQVIKGPMGGGGGTSRRWTYHYDQKGFVERVVDPAGREVRYNRDVVGRPTEKLLPKTKAANKPMDRTIGYSWDEAGNMTSLKPPGRPKHDIKHDAAGRPTGYKPPKGTGGLQSNVQYQWDAAHRLEQVKNPDGDVMNTIYEKGTGRIARLETSDRHLDFKYDNNTGKLAKSEVEQPATSKVVNSLAFERDGPLLTKSTWREGGTDVASVSRSYDNNFRLKSRTVRDGTGGTHKIGIYYNKDSQATKVGALTLQYARKNGLMTSTALQSTTAQWTYDKFGQPTAARATGPAGFSYANQYTYDILGRIETHTETLAGQTTAYKYGYDARGRLVDVYEDQNGDGNFAASEVTHHYTWGPNGNRLSVDTPRHTLTSSDITHDNQDRLIRYGLWKFTYDKSGTVEAKTQTKTGRKTKLTYDSMGNLTEVALPDGRTLRYTYDPNGRRITRRVLDQLGNETAFVRLVYGDTLNPVATLDKNGTLRARFVYGERGHVPSYMVKGGTTYRLVVDHLGSVRAVVDAQTGQVKQQLDYGPFGRVLEDTNPGFQPFGFAGGVYDPASELVHFSARNYDPLIGRWLKKDGIGFAGGDANLYGYVSEDPVNFIDPTGHYLESGLDLAFAAYSLSVFVDCPSWWNAAALGLDVGGGLIPAVAGAGSGLIHGDEAVGAVSKAINKADAGCFVAGTPVETKGGAKSIEEVEPGDYVWSRDPDTGQEAWREVTETTIRHDIPVLRLTTEGPDGSTDALSTTGEHPFWVNGQGWTAARRLEPGDEVFSSAGGWLKVTSATWLQDTRTVYNLEVDGFHTYFVGASGAWVHNSCGIWSKGRHGDSTKNAFEHWKKHGDEFPGLENSKQYVEKATNLINDPPNSALIKQRGNGDRLVYDPPTNTFAVSNGNGAPRTMFRPNDGIDYFRRQ